MPSVATVRSDSSGSAASGDGIPQSPRRQAGAFCHLRSCLYENAFTISLYVF